MGDKSGQDDTAHPPPPPEDDTPKSGYELWEARRERESRQQREFSDAISSFQPLDDIRIILASGAQVSPRGRPGGSGSRDSSGSSPTPSPPSSHSTTSASSSPLVPRSVPGGGPAGAGVATAAGVLRRHLLLPATRRHPHHPRLWCPGRSQGEARRERESRQQREFSDAISSFQPLDDIRIILASGAQVGPRGRPGGSGSRDSSGSSPTPSPPSSHSTTSASSSPLVPRSVPGGGPAGAGVATAAGVLRRHLLLPATRRHPHHPRLWCPGRSQGEARRERESRQQREFSDAISSFQPLDDIRIILASGAQVNGTVVQGLRPIHYAVYAGNNDALNLLLLRGAQVDVKDDVGYTPLHLCAEHGNLLGAEKLVLAGAQISFIEQKPGELFPRGIEIEDPLRLALKKDHYAVASLLLKHGASPNTRYFLGAEISLIPPAESALIALLLQYGADPNVYDRDGVTPLMRACRASEGAESAEALLRAGAYVNAMALQRQDMRTPLHFAVLAGAQPLVARLLQEGANVNMPADYDKATPLDLAVLKDSPGIVTLLLAHGADPNAVHTYIGSPLHLAVCSPLQHQEEMLRLLLHAGADPNLSPSFHEGRLKSPLVEYVRSALEPTASIVRLMLAYGGRVIMESPLRTPMGMLRNLLRAHDEELFALLLDAAEYWDGPAAERLQLPLQRRLLVHNRVTRPPSLLHAARSSLRRLAAPFRPQALSSLPIPRTLLQSLLFHYQPDDPPT